VLHFVNRTLSENWYGASRSQYRVLFQKIVSCDIFPSQRSTCAPRRILVHFDFLRKADQFNSVPNPACLLAAKCHNIDNPGLRVKNFTTSLIHGKHHSFRLGNW
jgi:hypothetical protein